MKEENRVIFMRVLNKPKQRTLFEIAEEYRLELNRIEEAEANSFTCPFSNETFKIGDKTYLIRNNGLDEDGPCKWIISRSDLTYRSVAFFSSYEKGIEWNHAKFKPRE